MTAHLILAASLALTAAAPLVLAQTPAAKEIKAKPAVTLHVGDAAPALHVEKFLKGSPVTGFERGKTYVVEFWATWCGPCVQSMPHISELQHEFADKGLTVIGVNVWEDPEYNDGTFEKARAFAEKMGNKMAYTVAFDGSAKQMDHAWMQAAGRDGIPSAFVVDKAGKIAWIGHPAEMDLVIEGVTTGSWNNETGPMMVEAAYASFTDANKLTQASFDESEAAWNAAAAKYPRLVKGQQGDRFAALIDAKNYTKAYALGNQLVDEAVSANKPGAVTDIYTRLSDPDNKPAVLDKALLLKAVNADKALNGGEDARSYYRLARAHYAMGDFEAAKTFAQKSSSLEPSEKIREMRQKMIDEIAEKFGAKN